MSDPAIDAQVDEFLKVRKPGAHLADDVVADEFVLALGVDLTNYPTFDRVDDDVTYPRGALDIRAETDVDSGAELDDYSGPYRPDLRYTDFSREALAGRFLPWSEAYLQLCVDGWATEVAARYGAEAMSEIEWAAWCDQVVPELAGGARDQQPHQRPARALSGSHQSRCARYHSTVDSRASRSSRAGFQPRASTFAVLIE